MKNIKLQPSRFSREWRFFVVVRARDFGKGVSAPEVSPFWVDHPTFPLGASGYAVNIDFIYAKMVPGLKLANRVTFCLKFAWYKTTTDRSAKLQYTITITSTVILHIWNTHKLGTLLW